jgi:hypothetical protein
LKSLFYRDSIITNATCNRKTKDNSQQLLKQENTRYEKETNNQETKIKMSCDEKQYEDYQEALGQKSLITIKIFCLSYYRARGL